MKQQLPNGLTIVRVALALVAILILALAPQQLPMWLLGIFLVAAASDFLDGFLARRMQVVSDFGKIFDPLADKIVAFVFLIILACTGALSMIVVLLLIVRDLVVDGVRASLATHTVIPAIGTAKIKTALMFVLIIAALAQSVWNAMPFLGTSVHVLAVLTLMFSYVSAGQYARIFYRAYKSRTAL